MEHFVQLANLFRPSQYDDLALGFQGHIGLRIDDVFSIGLDVAYNGAAGLPPEIEISQGVTLYLIRKIFNCHLFQVGGVFPFHGQLVHKSDKVWDHYQRSHMVSAYLIRHDYFVGPAQFQFFLGGDLRGPADNEKAFVQLSRREYDEKIIGVIG